MNAKDILKSFDIKKNQGSALKAGESAGASGSFFFFSHDSRFLIKTINASEKAIMLDMLPDYLERIKKGSLLAKIYGIFTIKSKYYDKIDVLLMQNTAQVVSK